MPGVGGGGGGSSISLAVNRYGSPSVMGRRHPTFGEPPQEGLIGWFDFSRWPSLRQTSTTRTITNVVVALGIVTVTTSVAHDLATGDLVFQSGIGGAVEANGSFVITSTGASTYTLDGLSAITPYTSGGTVETPVNFDADVIGFATDLSENADISQSTAANRPAYKVNIQGGLPIARFDGSNDWLIPASAWATPAAFTYAFVVKPTDTAGDKFILGAASGGPRIAFSSTEVARIDHGGTGTMVTGVTAISAWSVVICWWDDVNAKIYVNGTEDATAAYSTNMSVGPNAIGSKTNITDTPYNGDLGEVVMYHRALSLAEISRLNDYLRKKWRV